MTGKDYNYKLTSGKCFCLKIEVRTDVVLSISSFFNNNTGILINVLFFFFFFFFRYYRQMLQSV